MTENPQKKEVKKHKDINWQNEANTQLNTSEWFGAILRYFWHMGRKKFNTFYNQDELKKNALIGWLFQIILIVSLIYIAYRYSFVSTHL